MSHAAVPSSVERVLICNERFLARFGVDRILMLLAEHLVAIGVDVAFACLRCDRAMLGRITDRIDMLEVPEGVDFAEMDDVAAAHYLPRLAERRIDAVVSGGWPFFGLAAEARRVGARGIFIDAGAVPHDGFGDQALSVQRELRRLRQRTLPSIDAVLPISRFIRDSQTEPDRGTSEGVTTVLLGADHMALRSSDAGRPDKAERRALRALDVHRWRGRRLILSLGRVEMSGYKNSAAAFALVRSLRAARQNVHLVLLVGPEPTAPPEDLRRHVTMLASLSDQGLQAVMERCALGVSLSLWEGFNLPVAEMQWLGRPVLAFAVGAHPEVIADPWFLCQSQEEMVSKSVQILASGPPAYIATSQRFRRFRERFTWKATLAQWTEVILKPPSPRRDAGPERRLILVDVSNSARDPANSGVIRVARRLSATLAARDDLDVLFVKWNHGSKAYECLSRENQPFLSSNAGPADWIGPLAETLRRGASVKNLIRARDSTSGTPPVLFLPEVILDGTAETRVRWGRANACRAAFIFYDMLPIYASTYVDADVKTAFPSYLAAICASDAVYAISGFSLRECERWHHDNGGNLPALREAVWLPAQFSDSERVCTPTTRTAEIEVLCVSTIEPRKNHRVLIEAFQLLRRRRKLPIRLHLVGNSYAGADGLADWLRAVVDADEAIVWHGILLDEALGDRYERASFTIYPSLTEGFGLPIMESMWMGRPCLCHDGGVMAELAADGGCLAIDMTNSITICAGIERLATDKALRNALTRQTFARRIETWHSYGDAIAERLQALH